MKTLINFPSDFSPIVIVTGDRRENPPQCEGDLLSYSLSNTDILYITYLNLPNAIIYSDKVFVMETETFISQHFGKKNILVIGSPAVNLLSRRINDRCAFRFSISDETRIHLNDQNEFINMHLSDEDDFFIYQQCLEGISDIDKILHRFVGLDPDLDELRRKANIIVPEFQKTRIYKELKTHPTRPIRFLMNKLSKPGIFDSLSKTTRGESIPAYKDYGLVSITKNPFCIDREDSDYWIIYVGGVHGPATALGLKLLSDKDAFDDHPFGGVFEVRLPRFVGYFEKIQKSKARWETPAYSEDSMPPQDIGINNTLKAFMSSPSKKADKQQRFFNQDFCNLLKSVCEEQDHILRLPNHIPFHLIMLLIFGNLFLIMKKLVISLYMI